MRVMIRRRITMIVLVVVCFLLQSTIFQSLKFASICPNFMLILTTSIGFMRGKRPGIEMGFICGLVVDFFWGSTIGLYTLVFMFIGYFNGIFHHMFYEDDIKMPLLLVAASDFIYGIITYVLMYMLKGDFAFFTYLNGLILPELVYTVLITIVFYQLLLWINKWLESHEQRSESRFV